MNYQDPKFDLTFGSNMSAFYRQLEEQERISKKFSVAESPVSLAIKQLKQDTGQSELNKVFSVLNAINDPIKQLTSLTATQELWNAKFERVFSPIWSQMEIFTKFHGQTAKMAKILNPSVSDFIQNNVRTNYAKAVSISAVEATYMETFERYMDEVDSETFKEITEDIISNPEWQEELKTLRTAFYQAYLSDEFTDAITDLVSRRLKMKNPKIVTAVITILIILYSIWGSMEGELSE